MSMYTTKVMEPETTEEAIKLAQEIAKRLQAALDLLDASKLLQDEDE